MTQQREQSKNNSQTASDAAVRSIDSSEKQATLSKAQAATEQVSGMPKALARSPKKIPDKCIRCSMLSMVEVQSLHGATGDNCYVSQVCRSRRSYARHRYQRNQTRKQKWHETKAGVDVNPIETQATAQLILYREPRYNAPIDGVAAIVRQGKNKLAVVQPVYCAGLLPKQIYACIEVILVVLQEGYGISKFAGIVQQLPRSWEEPENLKRRSPCYPEIRVDVPGVTDCYSAVLMVYRQPETAVMAIQTEVWRGSTPVSGTPLLDCRGLMPSQIHAYLGQVLALLESHYKIRWFARRVELPLKSGFPLVLDLEQASEAEPEPESRLDLDPLWQDLEVSVKQRGLSSIQTLDVAAEGIFQIVLQFTQFAELAFEELEVVAERGVILPANAFDRYVRQTVEVDFEQFIEPLMSLPRKTSERQNQSDENSSVVGELDRAAVLQVLDEQMRRNPGLTEVEAFNQAMELAHDEDISSWVRAIVHWMKKHQISTIPLVQLQQAMGMPLVQLWLALLLGGYEIEQRGEFYETGQIWVLGQCQR